MKITIEGAVTMPRWEALQGVVRETLKSPTGRFVRIQRMDGGCNYGALGAYTVGYEDNNGTTNIDLLVR